MTPISGIGLHGSAAHFAWITAPATGVSLSLWTRPRIPDAPVRAADTDPVVASATTGRSLSAAGGCVHAASAATSRMTHTLGRISPVDQIVEDGLIDARAAIVPVK